jgi:hypothetical protein
LNERISGTVYSLDLGGEDVIAALKARKVSLGAQALSDVDFVESELARFSEKNPGSAAAFQVDRRGNRIILELPALCRRGLRPQDIVGAVTGLDNPSVYLIRERLSFRPKAEPVKGEAGRPLRPAERRKGSSAPI